MPKPKFRSLLLLIFLLLCISLPGTVQAQVDSSPKPGWGIGDENHLHLGPPGLSVRPIEDPADIPEFIAAIQEYIIKIRAYIASVILLNLFA